MCNDNAIAIVIDKLGDDVESNWAIIDYVEEDFLEWFDKLNSRLSKESVIRAVREILENGIKYGNPDTQVLFYSYFNKAELSFVLENETNKDNIDKLKDMVSFINSFSDPEKAYLESIKRSMMLEEGQSQLGLASIRNDTKAEISITTLPERARLKIAMPNMSFDQLVLIPYKDKDNDSEQVV